MTRANRKIGSRLLGAAVLTAALVGCDVTNPGPVQDEFLDVSPSHAPLVRGAERTLTQAITRLALMGALPSREIFPSGQGTDGLGNIVSQAGNILPEHSGPMWNFLQQARWIAEDAIARFTQPGYVVAPAILTQARLWAAYSNKIFGENFCEVVFNGGPAQAPEEALKRAEKHFTDAVAGATTDAHRYAAYAGRAQTRMALGNWSGAVEDATRVPVDFALQVQGTGGAELDVRNLIFFAVADLPYRNFSMHFTNFYDYFLQTGDPRAAWESPAGKPFANGSWPGYGLVPFSRPLKHNRDDYPFTLASGREMLLIRAEAILVQTPANWQQAMTLINQVHTSFRSTRTNQPLTALPATNLAEAWTALMQERGVELMLEGKRLFDIRRWETAKVPGRINLPDFESKSTLFRQTPQSRCFPIPQAELDRNPNLAGR
jgi:hypothetical protein